MNTQQIRTNVYDAVLTYCRSKGGKEGDGVNNFVPHDVVSAYAMAFYLTHPPQFDTLVAIAPEGYIYGYFFSVLGYEPQGLYVDFPPTRYSLLEPEKLKPLQRILLIEDDVIGGTTLQLVVKALQPYYPAKLALYLGHHQGYQHLENIPAQISDIYLAEKTLDDAQYTRYEQEFYRFFEPLFGDHAAKHTP